MAELSLKRRRSGAISGSERITGVKNAQADVLLTKRKQHFDALFKRKEQDIQLEEHRLANENKLLNLENKRNELEYKRRLFPDADLSNDEMTVNNLEKYLVRNAGKLCYTDKSLEKKVRIKCSTDTVSPIVAEARTTMTKKELLRAVEKNRQHMYDFLDKPVSREQKRTEAGVTDGVERVARENKLPAFPDQLASKEVLQPTKVASPRHLALPMVNKQPTNIRLTASDKAGPVRLVVPAKKTEKMELHKKLEQNPVVKEAMDAHHKNKQLHNSLKSRQSVSGVVSMMSRKKPPTKTQVKEEQESVQCQVGEFCQRIEALLWQYKEEQFKQSIKFVADKDAEWNKFMETMKKRSRATNDKEEEEVFVPEFPKPKRPTTSAMVQPINLPESVRERLLMENLVVAKGRQVESAPVRKRGLPHHTELRSHHHSPRAKLQRMLENNKNVLEAVVSAAQEKQEPGTAELGVAMKQSQAAAL